MLVSSRLTLMSGYRARKVGSNCGKYLDPESDSRAETKHPARAARQTCDDVQGILHVGEERPAPVVQHLALRGQR